MSKSKRHRADLKAQQVSTPVYLTPEEITGFEEARRQALTSDGSGEERQRKVLELLDDCDPEYCVGFRSDLISATVRQHWPVQDHQRIADDIGRRLKFILSLEPV